MIMIIKEKIEWHANRLLSKLNYVVHTDALKNNKNVKELEVLQQQVNEGNKHLIGNR